MEPATFFYQAYSSCQRSAIEDINGRLQRDLPREIDIDKLSNQEFQDIFLMHNLTPRKNLNCKTPAQAFLLRLGLDIKILILQGRRTSFLNPQIEPEEFIIRRIL